MQGFIEQVIVIGTVFLRVGSQFEGGIFAAVFSHRSDTRLPIRSVEQVGYILIGDPGGLADVVEVTVQL